MTLDVVIDAEIVEPLDKKSAEQLDRRIRLLVGTVHDQMAKLHELVAKAKRGNVHAALGFPSWTAYLADVFTVDVRLGRQHKILDASRRRPSLRPDQVRGPADLSRRVTRQVFPALPRTYWLNLGS